MDDFTQFNCYTILGINDTASYDDIRYAYRSASKRFHPDVSNDESIEPQIRINLAFEILTNPILREHHDNFWKKKSQPPRMSRPASARRNETRNNPTSYERVYRRVKKEAHEKGKGIQSSTEKRTREYSASYEAVFRKKRFRFIVKAATAFVMVIGCVYFPLAFILIIPLAAFALAQDSRAYVDYDTIFVLARNWKARIARAGKLAASFSIERDLKRLEEYAKILKIIKEEIMRGSRSSDSEKAVAGRLALAFFLMGYIPFGYESRTRTVRFSIGSDTVLVRYRHRKGIPTNVSYIKKMAELMHEANASKGFIFSSPGLSGKALSLANENNIASYSLKEMNEWIRIVYRSGHTGPLGSILDALDSLSTFLRELATKK